METRSGLAAQCSTSGRPAGPTAGGRPASLGVHAHAGCYLGRRAPSSSLSGTPLLPLVQGERRSAPSSQRCREMHYRSGRRRNTAVTSAVFGGLGKLFKKNDIAERTRGQYQVAGHTTAPCNVFLLSLWLRLDSWRCDCRSSSAAVHFPGPRGRHQRARGEDEGTV